MTFGCLVGHVFLNVPPVWLSAGWRVTSPRSAGILRRRRKAAEPVTDRSVGSELTGVGMTTRHINSCLHEPPHGGGGKSLAVMDGVSLTDRLSNRRPWLLWWPQTCSTIQTASRRLPCQQKNSSSRQLIPPAHTVGFTHPHDWWGSLRRLQLYTSGNWIHCEFSAPLSLQMAHLNLAGIAWGLRSLGQGLKLVNRFLSFFFSFLIKIPEAMIFLFC